jgi:hypothetical protein
MAKAFLSEVNATFLCWPELNEGMELWFYVSMVILVSMAFPGFKFQKISGGDAPGPP